MVKEIKEFNTKEVQLLIKELIEELLEGDENRINEIINAFQKNNINGKEFLSLEEKELINTLQIKEYRIRINILLIIKEYNEKDMNQKLNNNNNNSIKEINNNKKEEEIINLNNKKEEEKIKNDEELRLNLIKKRNERKHINNKNNIETTILDEKEENFRFFTSFNSLSFFFQRDSKIFSCGRNDYGQLLLGNNENQYEPKEVDFFKDKKVKNIYLSNNHSFYLTGFIIFFKLN
jgi:hypothetical protein